LRLLEHIFFKETASVQLSGYFSERLSGLLDTRRAGKLSDLICDAVNDYCVQRDMPKAMTRKRAQDSAEDQPEDGATDPKRQCTQVKVDPR
jgi:hypothetical protein